MNLKSESLINQIFFEKYKIIRKIGQGSFGRIYSCQDITTNELFAMKVEQNSFQNNVLEIESKYLSYLKGFGIPELKYFGTTKKYNILIETLLDKSLENLFSESHGSFNLKDICMIGIQVLERLEYIHNKNIIHRDIKPDNFVIGKNKDKKIIYLIDFGLAKRYRNPLNFEHIPFKMTKRLTGTARYASVNALKGGEQSRRDDLESLVYMLLFFLKGSLPWQGVHGITKGDKYKKIYYMKKNYGVERLFENSPNEFKELYLYVKKLEFEQEPDYNYCKQLLTKIIEKTCGEKNDNFFTWCKEINVLNKNYFLGNNIIISNNIKNNDDSGKTMKSTKIINMYNSNILLDKINNKKIKKISITFIDKSDKNKNKIMNCGHNFSLQKKRTNSLILDNICDIDKITNDNKDIESSQKNKEIIVTSSKKNNDSNEDYSIEGEIEKNKKILVNKNNTNNNNNNNNNTLNYKNKINILSLTKINKKKDCQLINLNKFNKNLLRAKTNRDLFNFTKKNFNIIMNSQIGQKTSRNKNKSNESKTKSKSKSKSKSGIKIKQKNKTNISNNILYKDILNNSTKKITKTRNKIISVFKTHTNIRNKNKSKIKHSIQMQSTSRNNDDKSNKKMSILLEDYINSRNNNNIKNQNNTSRTNNIKNYLKNLHTNKLRYSNISSYTKRYKNNITKDNNNNSNNNNEIKNSKRQKSANSNNTSKDKSKSKSKNKNKKEQKKYNSLTKKINKFFSINNKMIKVQQIFLGNKKKKDIIININKCSKKRQKSNNVQKSESYLNKIFNRKKINRSNIYESRNNTINIESIFFVGDNSNNNNNNNQYSLKSLNKNNKMKSIIYTPNNRYIKKNNNYNGNNNFLKKFKISILCSNKKNNTNNNSIKNPSNSKAKKRIIEDKKITNYNNNSSHKISENIFKINNKRNKKNVINSFNNKKIGPMSYNNLITNNTRGEKKNINLNSNIFCNNSLIEKKYFFQSSFNSSDSNYILNNINNNNIVVNNYNNNNSNNNSTSHISKKMINSYTINHQNLLSDEINENSYNNNFGGFSNNNNINNSLFKDFIIRTKNIDSKKKNNSRQNIMKYIKKYHKNNIIIKDSIQKSKNKKTKI